MRGTGKHHIRISTNGKRMYLHRQILIDNGYDLKDSEIVHHKDHNKFNNSVENLEILDGRAKHLHLHNYYRDKHYRKMSDIDTEKEISAIEEFGF